MLFLNGPTPASFSLIFVFSYNNKHFGGQRDSNSDLRSSRRENRPLDHHHGPRLKAYLLFLVARKHKISLQTFFDLIVSDLICQDFSSPVGYFEAADVLTLFEVCRVYDLFTHSSKNERDFLKIIPSR